MINQFNKKTKAVLYWTGKIWAASDEYAGTFNFENLGNFIFPDTVLFLFDNDELVVIDIADEIKRDYMAFDRYDNSVAFIHSVGGTTNLRDKISTFLDKNPSDIFKYKDVHGDTGDFVLTNEFDKEEVLESDLVQSLMRTFTDKTPFIIKRNDVISPRIIYANPTCFVYYYISMLKGIDYRLQSYSSLYRHFLANLIFDLETSILIFLEPKARLLFVDPYLYHCKNDARFVYDNLRPVLKLFQTLNSASDFEQLVIVSEKIWHLKWNVISNILIIQNQENEVFYSNYFNAAETHLFKPMERNINTGFHYSLLPQLSSHRS